MVKNAKLSSLFQSDRRGTDDVERRLEIAVREMQTPENLRKLRQAITKDLWGKKPAEPASMDFSKFEAKLNKVKNAFFEELNNKKDNNIS